MDRRAQSSARTAGAVHPRLQAFPSERGRTIDLGAPATIGKWYDVQLDLDAVAANVHSRVTDIATGLMVLDNVTSLLPYGDWNPSVDGIFNTEGYFSGEVTAKTTSGLAVLDNIDAPIPEPTTMVLLGSALAVGAVVRRRK